MPSNKPTPMFTTLMSHLSDEGLASAVEMVRAEGDRGPQFAGWLLDGLLDEQARRLEGRLKAARDMARMLSVDQVAEHFGISRATIWRMVRDGLFPEPERLGHRLRRWSVTKLNEWIDAGFPGLNQDV